VENGGGIEMIRLEYTVDQTAKGYILKRYQSEIHSFEKNKEVILNHPTVETVYTYQTLQEVVRMVTLDISSVMGEKKEDPNDK